MLIGSSAVLLFIPPLPQLGASTEAGSHPNHHLPGAPTSSSFVSSSSSRAESLKHTHLQPSSTDQEEQQLWRS